MAKAAARTAKAKTKATKPPTNPVTTSPRPGSKLGLVVEQIAAKDGATIGELATLTGWQQHTVRGSLSRLRRRGFPIWLEDRAGRRVYRLDPAGS